MVDWHLPKDHQRLVRCQPVAIATPIPLYGSSRQSHGDF